jgi:small-conductance mechanosensitive channel
VTYESDIETAKRIMMESAKEVIGDVMERNHETYRRRLELHDLDDKLPKGPLLRMDLSDSGVNVSVIYWCPAETRRKTRTDITERIWERFMEEPSVGIAYPHVEVVRHKESWDGIQDFGAKKKK